MINKGFNIIRSNGITYYTCLKIKYLNNYLE
jgi:hypothetical protein